MSHRRPKAAELGLGDPRRPGRSAALPRARVGRLPRTVRRHRREVMRLLAEVSFGSGALAVIGGTVGVICFLTFFTGTEVGLQGYQALDQLGSSAFTGFISAYFNTREIAPLVAGDRARPRPSAAASPPSSAPCGSPRRSTRSR